MSAEDLITRLRERRDGDGGGCFHDDRRPYNPDGEEAAREIERLQRASRSGTLDWRPISEIGQLVEGEVVLISHNRGTWCHADEARNNCVVVTYEGEDGFSEFGPDQFELDEVVFFARFNPPVTS